MTGDVLERGVDGVDGDEADGDEVDGAVVVGTVGVSPSAVESSPWPVIGDSSDSTSLEVAG